MTTLSQSEIQPPKTPSLERYNMPSPVPSLVTVYYDGKCGLCRKEISHYKKIAPEGQFIWSDIAHDATPLSQLGVSQMDALRRLHATDRNGRLHIGVDGLFLETHPNPSQAKSDGANMLQLDKLEDLLIKLVKIRKAII